MFDIILLKTNVLHIKAGLNEVKVFISVFCGGVVFL